MHYTMASMLRFLADEPIFSQAENIQASKTVSIIISNMCTLHPPKIYLKEREWGL
jgi:hypothetical protein